MVTHCSSASPGAEPPIIGGEKVDRRQKGGSRVANCEVRAALTVCSRRSPNGRVGGKTHCFSLIRELHYVASQSGPASRSAADREGTRKPGDSGYSWHEASRSRRFASALDRSPAHSQAAGSGSPSSRVSFSSATLAVCSWCLIAASRSPRATAISMPSVDHVRSASARSRRRLA